MHGLTGGSGCAGGRSLATCGRSVTSLTWLPSGFLQSGAPLDRVMGSPEVGFLVGPWVLAPAPVPGSYHPSRHCGGRDWFLWSQSPCLTPAPGPNLGLICTEHEMGPDRHTGLLIPILGDGLADDPCVSLLLASQSAGRRCGLGVECKSGFTVYFTATVQTFSVSAIFMCSFI